MRLRSPISRRNGLHVTPYCFCLNSFTVDPCPKRLECFNGCRHLTRTEIGAERRALETLRERMQRTVDQILATTESHRSIGWQNQLNHARRRLENIERTLTTTPGERPFPSGADLSRPLPHRSPATNLSATGCACRKSNSDIFVIAALNPTERRKGKTIIRVRP